MIINNMIYSLLLEDIREVKAFNVCHLASGFALITPAPSLGTRLIDVEGKCCLYKT